MCECICVGMCMSHHEYGGQEDGLWKLGWSFHHGGTRDRTQIIRLGGKHLHFLNDLLQLGFCCADKNTSQKQLWEEGFISSSVPYHTPAFREVRTGAQGRAKRQELKQRPWEECYLLACSHTEPRTSCPRLAPCTPISNQEKTSRLGWSQCWRHLLKFRICLPTSS